MNVQLANVISDLSGLTGQAIVRAILAGERHPWKLAQLCDPRIQASRKEIAKSLEGNWGRELLFVLQQEVEIYDTYQRRIAECDQQLQNHLARFVDKWTHKTTENIAAQLQLVGIPVGRSTVARLLYDLDYSLRINQKRLAPAASPDRHSQFLFIQNMRQRFQRGGHPIISLDTKKQELIGNFKNPGPRTSTKSRRKRSLSKSFVRR